MINLLMSKKMISQIEKISEYHYIVERHRGPPCNVTYNNNRWICDCFEFRSFDNCKHNNITMHTTLGQQHDYRHITQGINSTNGNNHNISYVIYKINEHNLFT